MANGTRHPQLSSLPRRQQADFLQDDEHNAAKSCPEISVTYWKLE